MDDLNLSQKTSRAQKSIQGGPHFDPHLIEADGSPAGNIENTGYLLKRSIDLLVSGMALVILFPVFLILALTIKITSPGSIFFRQKRLGVGEKPFMILKFRSMRTDSESTGPQFTTANDSRITGIGKFIRKTSLDEIPQLINIFRGEMSLIGPRPYVGFELADVSVVNRQQRASIRPGVSGLAQVSGRSRLSQSAVIQFDLEYVEKCSLMLDLRIVLKTVQKVITCEGTN
ncbi:MAG: sugar transferase [Gimesia sp.]